MDFRGRVKLASKKNFQLECPDILCVVVWDGVVTKKTHNSQRFTSPAVRACLSACLLCLRCIETRNSPSCPCHPGGTQLFHIASSSGD
jgi:hypothetical protein